MKKFNFKASSPWVLCIITHLVLCFCSVSPIFANNPEVQILSFGIQSIAIILCEYFIAQSKHPAYYMCIPVVLVCLQIMACNKVIGSSDEADNILFDAVMIRLLCMTTALTVIVMCLMKKES